LDVSRIASGAQTEKRRPMKQYTAKTWLGDLWGDCFTDRSEVEAIIGPPPFETLMVRDGETDPWRVARHND
jgi:hypothetical protein